MKYKLLSASALLCSALLSGTAQAQTVLGFDDLSPNVCNNDRSGNIQTYGGVSFGTGWTCYGDTQSPYTPSSPRNRIYASNPTTLSNASSGSFSFGAPVDFLGAWFSGAASVQFTFFLGAAQVGQSGTLGTTSTPAFLAAGYAGPVDRVQVDGIAATGGSSVQWVMDDVTFNVPEPGSFALLAVGATAMVGVARRRRAV